MLCMAPPYPVEILLINVLSEIVSFPTIVNGSSMLPVRQVILEDFVNFVIQKCTSRYSYDDISVSNAGGGNSSSSLKAKLSTNMYSP